MSSLLFLWSDLPSQSAQAVPGGYCFPLKAIRGSLTPFMDSFPFCLLDWVPQPNSHTPSDPSPQGPGPCGLQDDTGELTVVGGHTQAPSELPTTGWNVLGLFCQVVSHPWGISPLCDQRKPIICQISPLAKEPRTDAGRKASGPGHPSRRQSGCWRGGVTGTQSMWRPRVTLGKLLHNLLSANA